MFCLSVKNNIRVDERIYRGPLWVLFFIYAMLYGYREERVTVETTNILCNFATIKKHFIV